MTLISGPQLDSGRIWSDTETVNVINYMMEKKWITNDFTVKDPSAIVDYAAKKCGFLILVDSPSVRNAAKLKMKDFLQRLTNALLNATFVF